MNPEKTRTLWKQSYSGRAVEMHSSFPVISEKAASVYLRSRIDCFEIVQKRWKVVVVLYVDLCRISQVLYKTVRSVWFLSRTQVVSKVLKYRSVLRLEKNNSSHSSLKHREFSSPCEVAANTRNKVITNQWRIQDFHCLFLYTSLIWRLRKGNVFRHVCLCLWGAGEGGPCP